MALFGKKTMSLDEILKAIKSLSEEEQKELFAKMQGNTEETKDVEEVEETEQATDEAQGEATEETETETTEEETQDIPEETGEESAGVEGAMPEEESARDEMAEDNSGQIIQQLTDRVNELSEQVKGLLELKEVMEEYTKKQAESFGYKGDLLGVKKDVKDMSTEELKARQMKGI